MLPLHAAIENFDLLAVRALLESGVDPNAVDPSIGSMRALNLAVDIECEDSCRRYDAGETASRPAADFTSLLISAGADPDMPDARGETAREMALARNHHAASALFPALI